MKPTAYPWRTLVICVTLILMLALLVAFSHKAIDAFDGARMTVDKGLNLANKIVDESGTILANFRTGQITQTFRESYPRIGGNGGDVLEVATNRVTEIFKKTDEKRLFWDRLYLGTTTAEIQVDAIFRYHVLLSDEWRLATRSNVCVVLGPRIRPTMPTAIDTETIRKSADNGWARFDKAEQLATLEKAITPALDERAGNREHLNMVRDACRRSVAEFVRTWLLKEDHWRADRFTSVIVVFPDEGSFPSDEELVNLQAEPALTF